MTLQNPDPSFFLKPFIVLAAFMMVFQPVAVSQNYKIVGTGQTMAYNESLEIAIPSAGQNWYGQNANYPGNTPSYTNNGDGTVTDQVTGLMWSQSPDLDGDGVIDYSDKLSYDESLFAADTLTLAGYSDWRLPTVKELYSLILFNGIDPSGYTGTSTTGLTPFIDTNFFRFAYGDLSAGERIIDAQMVTSTLYVSTTMMGDATMFGVNFADGRIKGYPTGPMPGQAEDKQFYVYFVRGNNQYGVNQFVDKGDGTITDNATGLMWMQNDNGAAVLWEEALSYAEAYNFGGYSDWRLPSVKELQSIVDYTRSPATTNSAAIDPLFTSTQITDEGGEVNYPFYWSGTTHANFSALPGNAAAYVCFGEALGWMEFPPMSGNYQLMDVHGAGAQRSDFKTGDPASYPFGNGPQGDVVRIVNYVRLVRDAGTTGVKTTNSDGFGMYPIPATDWLYIEPIPASWESGTISVYSLMGEKLQHVNLKAAGCNKIDIGLLKPGAYIVAVESNDGSTYQSFIKK